jgi:environmental stress-induced protein Ves
VPQIVRFNELIARPWKNGGGATRTVGSAPEDVGLDDFDWRLSIADVASDGPFSHFDGVDRTLAILDGPGMTLSIAGKPTRLDRDRCVVSFAGEADVVAALLGAPTRDFNVMTRRSRYIHRVWRLTSASVEIGAAETVAIVAVGERVSIAWPSDAAVLTRLDAVFATSHDGTLVVDGDALVVRLTPVRP